MTIAIRQIIDIQNQIRAVDPFLKNGQLESLFIHNAEIKTYLLEHIKDDFVRKHIYEIPDFRIDDFRIKRNYFQIMIAYFAFYESFNIDKYDYLAAKDALYIIGDKYASLELLVKNSSTSL